MLRALKSACVVQLTASLSHRQPGGSSEATAPGCGGRAGRSFHLAQRGNCSPLMLPPANHLRTIRGKDMSQVGVWKLSLTPGNARKAQASELEDGCERFRGKSQETRAEQSSEQCCVANSRKGTEHHIVLKPLTSKIRKWFRTVGFWTWRHFRNFNNFLTYLSKHSWEW